MCQSHCEGDVEMNAVKLGGQLFLPMSSFCEVYWDIARARISEQMEKTSMQEESQSSCDKYGIDDGHI